MAGQQRLGCLYFLVALVTGPCRATLRCRVEDASQDVVTGDLRTEGTYTFTSLTDACSLSVTLVRPGYADSNVRMRLLEITAWVWVTVSDGDGNQLGTLVNVVRHSNVSESFQSPNSLIISMTNPGFFKAQIEHFTVPGFPVNSSATRLTASDEVHYLTSFGYPIGYPNSLHFIYFISTSEFGRRVEIVMDTLQMANSGEGGSACSEDYVEVGQPYNTVRWCQGSHTIVSSGPEIIIIFHTNASRSQKGFKLKYRSVDGSYTPSTPARSECSHFREALGETSYLAWPIYPYNSDLSNECRWIIGTGVYSDSSVKVHFLEVDLRDGEVLQLYDGSSAEDGALLDKIDEGALRRVYHSSSSTLLLVFRSSAAPPERQIFWLSFTRVESSYIYCNTTVIVGSEASVFKSARVSSPSTCWYRLQASYGFAVSLVSAKVSFPLSNWMLCPSWLRFYADSDETTYLCTSGAAMANFPVAKRSVIIWFHAGSDDARFSFLLKEQAGNDEVPTTTAVITTTAVRTLVPELLDRSTEGSPEMTHRNFYVVSDLTRLIPPGYSPGPRQDVYVWTCSIDAADDSKRIRLKSNIDYWGWTGSCDFVDVYDGTGRSDRLLAHWCGNERLSVTSTYSYLFLEFRASYGSRESFVIEAELVSDYSDPNSGTPSAINVPEAVAISGGAVAFLLLWVVFALCLRRARRRRRLRELRSHIDRMIVLQLETGGRMVAADDARPLLAARDTPARPWWQRVLTREQGEDVDYDEAPPPYPGLPDLDPRETTPHDPPPPYTLSAHDVSIPTSDRPFLERSQGAATDSSPRGEENMGAPADSSPWGEENMAATADSSPWGEENMAAPADSSPWGEENMTATADSSPWGEENMAATADSSPWEEDYVAASDDSGPREVVAPSSDASSPAAEGSTQADSDDVPCLLLRGDDDDDENREDLIRLDDERSDVL